MAFIVSKNTKRLQGEITIPGSKSHSIRALIIALLADGESILINALAADDVATARVVCQGLGAAITEQQQGLQINSAGLPLSNTCTALHTGDSGITTCFILPLIGLRKNPEQAIVVDCGTQMRTRPIASLIAALRTLGLTIDPINLDRVFPLRVSGVLQGGVVTVDGSNSQYLSALLLALPCALKDSVITVEHLQERPYVEMTLAWLQRQAIRYQHQTVGSLDIYRMEGRQQYQPFITTIPADFSSASYFIAAAVLCHGLVEIKGLMMTDTQGDKRLIPLLQAMGAAITLTVDSIVIEGGKALTGCTIDASDVPDLLPILAVIGTQAQGKTVIKRVAHARLKETDRIHSMTEGLRAMGAAIDECEDGMTVYASVLQGAAVKGYGDHRTVMALSVAGMLATGTTIIDEAQAINKTFPDFVQRLKDLGANMELDYGR